MNFNDKVLPKMRHKLKFKQRDKIIKGLDIERPIDLEKNVTTDIEIPKSKKLKFKKVKKVTNTKVINELNENHTKNLFNIDKKCNLKFDDENTSFKTMKIHYVPKVYEYGTEIEGYKFIAFDDSQILKKSTTVLSDSSNSDSNNSDDDLIIENKTTYSLYQKYLSEWQEIMDGKVIKHIPFPVESGLYDDVTVENVKTFLHAKRIVKLERIRWHPDKMKILLLGANVNFNEEQITHIFQIVNVVYETWDNQFTNDNI